MAELKDILKKLRAEKNMSQVELAEEAGVSSSTVAMWEVGKRFPTRESYEQLADIFNVDIDYLYGRTEVRQRIHFDGDGVEYRVHVPGSNVPVLGYVRAGIPISAIEEILDYEEISAETASHGEHFGLKIKGDSMEPRICEGDVVIVRQQDDAETGDIVIALINGDDATCKKLVKFDGGIRLMPLNPTYEPLYFSNEEIINKPVKIIGKVVENRQKY